MQKKNATPCAEEDDNTPKNKRRDPTDPVALRECPKEKPCRAQQAGGHYKEQIKTVSAINTENAGKLPVGVKGWKRQYKQRKTQRPANDTKKKPRSGKTEKMYKTE